MKRIEYSSGGFMRPFSRRVPISAFALAAILLSLSSALSLDGPENREKAGKKPEAAKIAEDFRRHCALVRVFARTSDGDVPEAEGFLGDIVNERPTLVGGYWWDEKRILIADPSLPERFIRRMEVSLPGSEKRYGARVSGRFLHFRGMLVEVLPDDDGELPAAVPIEFSDMPDDEFDADAVIASYERGDDGWAVELGGGLSGYRLGDSDGARVMVERKGILLDADGRPAGVAMGDFLSPDGRPWLWRGRDVRESPFLGEDEYLAAQERIREKLRQSVLEVRFGLRVKIDEDGEEYFGDDEGEVRSTASEVRAAGLVVGGGRLLVPVGLDPASIARLESVTITLPDGSEVEGEFEGALKKYMAVVVSAGEGRLPAPAVDGFNLLGPEERSGGAVSGGMAPESLFLRWRVDYSLGRRRETSDSDRWLGLFRGYMDDPVVKTLANESNGSLAFNPDGGLEAVGLAPRLPSSEYGLAGRGGLDAPGFRPLGRLAGLTRSPGTMDGFLRPRDADEGKRLVDIGVEWQALDGNTARMFSAEKATRGGKIGMLVTHVYPGSEADRLGLREHDILLRVRPPDRAEAIELAPPRDGGIDSSVYDIENMSADAVQMAMSRMPPPWPSRENALSLLLTAIGEGREIGLEYLREGEARAAVFVSKISPPDYRAAPKYKSAPLGLTVKGLTYEARRFFRRPDDAGVILSRTEEGGRAAVAGLHPYLLVTHVDGVPVRDLPDFREKVGAFERGGAGAVELTVDGFGKTRLVKIGK